MNSFLNVQSADKYLQFGLDKCKAMVVGKIIESYHSPKLTVDTWKTSHEGIYGNFLIKEAHGTFTTFNIPGYGNIPRWSKYKKYHTKKEQKIGKVKKSYKSTEATWQI